MPREPRPQPLVQSVERSLEILEALAAADELGLLELAERTGLRPSTAHRLLATLVARGYAVRSSTNGRYLLGYRLAELAGVVAERTNRLRTLARPHLERIQEATGESANLSVLSVAEAIYIDQVEGTRSVRMLATIGGAVPAHASAAGKAMLAFAPARTPRELLGDGELAALTAHTIASVDALEQELARVRRRGYALDREEHEVGVSCIAAPVFDHGRRAVAALSVSAPTPRIDARAQATLGRMLRDHAAAISSALGFEAPPRAHSRAVAGGR